MTGIDLIAAERIRQVEVKGHTAEEDDLYVNSELAKAAACHAVWGVEGDDTMVITDFSTGKGIGVDAYPWEPELDTREKHTLLENLVIAGAMIAAEIDRLLRLEENLMAQKEIRKSADFDKLQENQAD